MTKLLFLNCLLHLDEGQKCFGRSCILIFGLEELVMIPPNILTFKIKINDKNNVYPLLHSQAIKDVYRKKLAIASYPLAHPLI